MKKRLLSVLLALTLVLGMIPAAGAVEFTPITESEPNDAFPESNPVEFNSVITGTLSSALDRDRYIFTLEETTRVTAIASSRLPTLRFSIGKHGTQTSYSCEYMGIHTDTWESYDYFSGELPAGTYYISVLDTGDLSGPNPPSGDYRLTFEKGAHEHDLWLYRSNRWADCDDPGERVYCCTYCTELTTVEVPPLGHDWSDNVCTRCSAVLGEHFLDVPAGQYYYDAVKWACRNNITTGTDDSHFSPYNTCTRVEVVSFLWRLKGCPAPASTENPFTDVEEGTWYYDAVLWAVQNGITEGTSKTTFSPMAYCSRAQVVTLLWRFYRSSPPNITDHPFTDVPEDAFYRNAVLWASENGITTGTTKTTFSPNAPCERAQIVTFLYRS